MDEAGTSRQVNELELFAGSGGGILGSELLGHVCVCAVEIDKHCRKVLLRRQEEGYLAPFPIWDDVSTFNGKPLRGLVDCVSGGFPCKGGSAARTNNPKRKTGNGLDHAESALWSQQFRIIGEVEPLFVRVENNPHLNRNGLDQILGDLASLGFDAEWDIISAGFLGACHERERTWVVASHPDRAQCQGGKLSGRANPKQYDFGGNAWWKDRPRVHRMDDEVANRMDRLKAVGNGQIPEMVALAWETLRP